MLTYNQYLTPKSLGEALNAIASGPDAQSIRLIAGGTDILPWARQGRAGDVHIDTLVDVAQLSELRGVRCEGQTLIVGAATPIADFIRSSELREYADVLSRCASWFADDQIRAQATVGGNLINASPAGDSQPALLVHNCKVTLAALEGETVKERSMPLAKFIVGPAKTDCRPNEILVRLELDALKGYGVAFEKVGHRRSLVISTVCLAVAVRVNGLSKKIDDCRIAIGAVGPVPQRLPMVENLLIGKIPDGAVLRETAMMVADLVRSRSRQEYRREVLVNFVERGVVAALADAGVSVQREQKEFAHD